MQQKIFSKVIMLFNHVVFKIMSVYFTVEQSSCSISNHDVYLVVFIPAIPDCDPNLGSPRSHIKYKYSDIYLSCSYNMICSKRILCYVWTLTGISFYINCCEIVKFLLIRILNSASTVCSCLLLFITYTIIHEYELLKLWHLRW
jgi:hypothetical protein